MVIFFKIIISLADIKKYYCYFKRFPFKSQVTKLKH